MKILPSPLTPWENTFAQFLTAKDYYQQHLPKKALDLLLKVSEEQPQFPETYYYLWKAGAELNRDVEVWQKKYVSLCKNVVPRERRKFANEPKLCSGLKEVEDDLAK